MESIENSVEIKCTTLHTKSHFDFITAKFNVKRKTKEEAQKKNADEETFFGVDDEMMDEVASDVNLEEEKSEKAGISA